LRRDRAGFSEDRRYELWRARHHGHYASGDPGKRRWIEKQEFVEGLALVNMLPGPGATQLGVYISHIKAGLAGGIIAGVCFVLPAFLIMLMLVAFYATFGALPRAARTRQIRLGSSRTHLGVTTLMNRIERALLASG
jgi:Chromate transporter